ncbi:FRG domain-containing protein [Steroidobacter cummioxidans]|uniref:FRG domain-containing protein n=1 Tax=Steroidobacter cummioxidans TaxID=1803913 RepID=UPI00137B3014|nr:FRG domain-containing protein [Steroidobacter cummioxidans]
MELIRARTAKELFKIISPNGKLLTKEPGTAIFRGQADASWPVIPSALRPGALIPYSRVRQVCPRFTNRDQIELELQAIRDFGGVLDRAGRHVPHDDVVAVSAYPRQFLEESNKLGRGELVWPPKAYHSLIALAQHNGLPTRFVDFTYHPYVAAYFAAAGALHRKDDGSGELGIYIVLGWARFAVSSYEFREEPWEVFLPRESKYCYQLIQPPAFHNEYLRAQKACFLAYLQFKPRANELCEVRSLERYFEDRVQQEIAAGDLALGMPKLIKVTLGTRHAPSLLDMLSREGVDASTIFPSISGCVRSMYERCEDDVPGE